MTTLTEKLNNFVFTFEYFFKYIVSFVSVYSIHHSPHKETSPQNRLQELCSKECILIFAQKKEKEKRK
uniref:Uncharacterized protein n=1 Tax=Laticauda laticaudata TaxID=8630 RepID=A0A8C5STA5_LATLA